MITVSVGVWVNLDKASIPEESQWSSDYLETEVGNIRFITTHCYTIL